MITTQKLDKLSAVLENMPADWLNLTTHRLDIYNESQAKVEFIEAFASLYHKDDVTTENLAALPTAYDYIRLGHPLSSVLEWAIAQLNGLSSEQVISFASATAPILAILRTNHLQGKQTRILYADELPTSLDAEKVRSVYGFDFKLEEVGQSTNIDSFDGSTVFVSTTRTLTDFNLDMHIDFAVNIDAHLGSIVAVNDEQNKPYISEIQHFRRRETIAMTPADCLTALKELNGESVDRVVSTKQNKSAVLETIKEITGSNTEALVASSGLSMQYAIMMGLIDDAQKTHPEKQIKVLIPPNCYGGTNDQARRVAATLDQVEIVDLPVDAGNDMVSSVHALLEDMAAIDAVPYIIAEIPTNPRVEVPELEALRDALAKARFTPEGNPAVAPVFILDQTFCPNFPFLGADDVLADVKAIAYVSGSKFPSGGRCTAGYATANNKAAALMAPIGRHLTLCDNEATELQYEILAEQMPSMLDRIAGAYKNTRAFVTHIEQELPEAKINFVSEDLAAQGFTPSVFSLDLPTKGETEAERESYKRALNLKLINLMISEIPNESKYCVSYGQLKGCYWTIPATSTQGTTKEGDKDYIVRVAVAPDLDLEKHKEVFSQFVDSLK
ncbi:cystathionine beta-synthase [Gilvibacter sediminis]|uniref:cystathionine beta-synthase n=1 Tax=Gilvibacter sediminis TaxID=379071 RepID=UPI002350692F|nr:cystathionine beta-synthase [Gilvibacter sediminis]MDC7998602.1 cystathionine beta-synthase [Gilvibacter sediminis]